MFDDTLFTAQTVRRDEPDWAPLEAFLPYDLCGGFMWMQADELDGAGEVQAYKHGDTRRYLYLDVDAQPYEYLGGGRYRRMRRTCAIEQVLDMPWVLLHATEAEKALVKTAFEEAVRRDNESRDPDAQIAPASPAAAFRWLP